MGARVCVDGVRLPPFWSFPGSPGCLPGMSLLCKLNGFLGLGIVAAWCGLTWLLPRLSIGRKLAVTGATIVTIAFALVVAVAFNPYLTAQPAERLVDGDRPLVLAKTSGSDFATRWSIRLDISNNQKKNYPDDALLTDVPRGRASILVQGFGRFGPFGPRAADSKERYRPLARTGECSSGCRW